MFVEVGRETLGLLEQAAQILLAPAEGGAQRFGDVTSPGNEMFDMLGSKAADEKGSSNYWGLKDPVVDKLVTALVQADSRAELVAASRALDRVLLHKYIVVPHWYSATHRVAYRNRFGMPKITPKYYQADPYVISSWWQMKPRKSK